ncbi:glycosyltransferase family 39 protein [Arsenicicoccus piscis]|uniref:glycosyltransferase family 39 protein n=1 Tax=Arsenicicoccus piscis TaxID=673954 RepID=UPI001F4C8E18|nr:glycosyltransferase family 39 protein [Arsenicicoccus piscis]
MAPLPSPPAPWVSRRTVLAVLLVIPPLVLAMLALPVVYGVPLWRDEYATWIFSGLSLRQLWTATGHVDRVFLPYYAFTDVLRTLGASQSGLRLVSLLASMGTVTLVQLMGRRLWNAMAGFIAALVIATNPTFVLTAAGARSYALSTLFMTIAAWVIIVRPRHLSLRVRWWIYLVCITLALHMHLFSGLAIAPHLIWMALRVRSRFWHVALAWVLAGLAAMPLFVVSRGQASQVSWIAEPTWMSTVAQTAWATGGDLKTVGVTSTLLVSACAALGAWLSIRRRRVDPTWLIALLLWLGPVVGLTLVSLLSSPVSLWRYYLSTAVGAGLLVGYGASAVRHLIWPRRHPDVGNATIVALLVAAVAACCVPPLLVGRPSTTTVEGHPVVDQALTRTLRAGDQVVVHQGYSETGYVASFADQLHDSAWTRDATAALVGGQPSDVVRRVTAVDPAHASLATVASSATDPRASGRVVHLALYSGPESALTRASFTGCRPTPEAQPPNGSYGQTVVQVYTCTTEF